VCHRQRRLPLQRQQPVQAPAVVAAAAVAAPAAQPRQTTGMRRPRRLTHLQRWRRQQQQRWDVPLLLQVLRVVAGTTTSAVGRVHATRRGGQAAVAAAAVPTAAEAPVVEDQMTEQTAVALAAGAPAWTAAVVRAQQ